MTRINTKTHNTARISLGRLIRSFQHGEVTEKDFRALVYGMNCLLGFYRLDCELEIEKRLEAIEDQLERQKDETGQN